MYGRNPYGSGAYGKCRALALVDTRVSGTQPPSFGKKTGVLQAYSSGLSLGGTPRGVSKIDWSHPLSRGMTDCLVWNAGGSTPPQNLASPSAITTLTGSPIDAMTVAGPAGAVVSNVGYNIPDHLNYATGDVTIRLLFKPVSWPGGFTILFDKGTVSTREFSLFFDTSGNVQYVGLGGNSDSVAASTALTPGTVWDLVMQRSGTTLKFYVNGVFISNDHTTGWSSNTASGGNLGFGINPSGGGTKPDAQYITTQIWNRALDPSEISLLYSDPYCFLVPAEGEMPALQAPPPVQFSGTQAGSKQRGVLRAFSQGLDNLHLRQTPRGPVKIDWSHPLARGLIGAWLPGVSDGLDLTGNCNLTQTTNKSGPTVSQEGAAGGLVPASASSPIWSALAPPRYKTWSTLSMYYRGDRNTLGSTAGSDPYLIYLSYDNGLISPYAIAGIGKVSGLNDLSTIAAEWNTTAAGLNTGTPANFEQAGTVSALATFGNTNGNVVLYKNGAQVSSDAWGTFTYSTSANALMCINGWQGSGRTSPTLCYIACVWDRELTAAEAAQLNSDPYCFLIPAEREMPALRSTAAPTQPAWDGNSHLALRRR